MVVQQASHTSFRQLSARWSRVLGAATTSTLGEGLKVCVEDLGRYAEVDIAFVTLVDEDDRVSDDWHWVRGERSTVAPAVGSHLRDTFASGTEFLRLGHHVAVDDLTDIELSPTERALTEVNHLRALLLVPVRIGDVLVGLAGLLVLDESRLWTDSMVKQMRLLADLLVQAIIRTRDRGALLVADARARRISEFVPEGLVLVDTGGTITWASPSFSRLAGVAADAVVGLPLVRITHADDRRQLEAALIGSLGEPGSVQVRIRAGDDWRWCALSLRLASEPGSGVPDEIVVCVRDDHERQLQTELLARAAERDPLTGLLNRAGLARVFDEQARADGHLIVAYCDIDAFKSVNDAASHDVGDAVLVAMGRALEAVVRPDDLVARLGGDEFAVIVTDPGAIGDVDVLSDRLVAATDRLSGSLPSISLSVGLAGPGPARTAEGLLRAADQAMYAAKRAGKGCWRRTCGPDPV